MGNTPKLLAFSGSSRRGSFNAKLVQIAGAGAKNAGADVTVINLADFGLPLFDEDYEREKGTPDGAQRLKKMFIEHHGFIISSPEYNSSITAVLKNALDWVSRSPKGEAPLVAYTGKTAALMSASPGGLGGIRGLVHLRAILGNVGVILLPEQVTVSNAHEAFTDDGQLKETRQQKKVESLGAALAAFTAKLC